MTRSTVRYSFVDTLWTVSAARVQGGMMMPVAGHKRWEGVGHGNPLAHSFKVGPYSTRIRLFCMRILSTM